MGGFGQSGFALVRATVRLGAPVVGGRLKDLSFRSRFGASVVAIRRNGKHVGGKLGLAVLEVSLATCSEQAETIAETASAAGAGMCMPDLD